MSLVITLDRLSDFLTNLKGLFVTKTDAESTYETKTDAATHLTKIDAETTYATKTELTTAENNASNTYLSKTDAANTYATKEELNTFETTGNANTATKATQDSDGNQINTTYSKVGHTHDDRYYTETEVNNLLKGKADSSHTHSYIPTSASCNKNWHWSGQGGQPTWLWGGEDGTNMYVYNPSNFSVNYANSAGSANTANSATKATQDAAGNTITTTYLSKTDAANTYATKEELAKEIAKLKLMIRGSGILN